MKKKLALILCIVLILSTTVAPAAFASRRANAYIDSFCGQVTPKGNGKVRVDFGVEGTGIMDVLGASDILLYEDGLLVKTYYYTNPLYTSSMVTTNHWIFYGGVDYNGTAGKTYQAEITFYGEDSTGSDTEVYLTGSTVAT